MNPIYLLKKKKDKANKATKRFLKKNRLYLKKRLRERTLKETLKLLSNRLIMHISAKKRY
jgi:hypothetical protein